MTSHNLVACHLANLLAMVGRLDDAAAVVASGAARSQQERDGMALHLWALWEAPMQVVEGRLSDARETAERLAAPERPGSTFVNALRMFTLAEVAARTDDRTLLVDTLTEAREAYSNGSPSVRRGAAGVFDTYTQHEAIADARRVGRALRLLGVERRVVARARLKTGWDSLTDSELKVINLIAQGRPMPWWRSNCTCPSIR